MLAALAERYQMALLCNKGIVRADKILPDIGSFKFQSRRERKKMSESRYGYCTETATLPTPFELETTRDAKGDEFDSRRLYRITSGVG